MHEIDALLKKIINFRNRNLILVYAVLKYLTIAADFGDVIKCHWNSRKDGSCKTSQNIDFQDILELSGHIRDILNLKCHQICKLV